MNRLPFDQAIAVYLLGIFIVLIFSLTVVLTLRSYMRNLLLELNGERERHARFWVAWAGIILVLVPLIIAMMIVPKAGEEVGVFFQISGQVRWALIGLVVSVFVTGIAIHRVGTKRQGG